MSTFGISLGMFSNHWNYVVFLLYRFEKLIPQIGKMFCQIIKKYPFGEVKRDFVLGLLYPKDSQQQIQLRFICNCCIPVWLWNMWATFQEFKTIALLLFLHVEYGNTGCKVFKRGIQNKKYFCLKINIPKEDSLILRFGLIASCQKLGIILEKMWFKK